MGEDFCVLGSELLTGGQRDECLLIALPEHGRQSRENSRRIRDEGSSLHAILEARLPKSNPIRGHGLRSPVRLEIPREY